jgi:hypothetical protein
MAGLDTARKATDRPVAEAGRNATRTAARKAASKGFYASALSDFLIQKDYYSHD